jgi:hypothetical protein
LMEIDKIVEHLGWFSVEAQNREDG